MKSMQQKMTSPVAMRKNRNAAMKESIFEFNGSTKKNNMTLKMAGALVLIIVMLQSCTQKINEYAAIKRLLEKESATWRNGDTIAHANCWEIQPYSRVLVSTTAGKVIDVPPQLMIHPPPNSFGKGGSSVNSNYRMSIHGDYAWVSHDEMSVSPDGTKAYSY